jgi:lysophospholipase L1-like esterase
MKQKTIWIMAALLLFFAACDKRKDPASTIDDSLRCQLVGDCSGNTKFGMVGDSWTDFALGLPVLVDLYDQLTEVYGYRITASNLAGLTLRTEWESRRGFERVIHKGGPNLRYMLLSLGGNDMIASEGEYSGNPEVIADVRLANYESRLRLLITNGDLLKQSLYGGEPLTWIIHGYDYLNPLKENSCVDNYSQGASPITQNQLPGFVLDRFNARLQYLTTQIPNLRYIDARGTLGGPPYSSNSLMFDCIHPNNEGFALYAAAYVARLDLLTGGAR